MYVEPTYDNLHRSKTMGILDQINNPLDLKNKYTNLFE